VGNVKTRTFVVNVYSKYDLMEKRRLCHYLLEVERGLGEDDWCIVGDLNAVCWPEERRGVNKGSLASTVAEMNFFNIFLRELKVDDVNILGRKFTWYHSNGGP